MKPLPGLDVPIAGTEPATQTWYEFFQTQKADVATLQANAARTKLTTATTFYVRTDGNDSHNGSANTSGSAFLTIQACYNYIANTYDFGGQAVTIRCGNAGTYTAGLNITNGWSGGGSLIFDGGGCTIDAVGGISVSAPLPGILYVTNVTFATTGASTQHIFLNAAAIVSISSGVTFGNAGTGDHMTANTSGARIQIDANYTISGGGRYHLVAQLGGVVNWYTGVALTCTVSANITFSGAWAVASENGVVFTTGNTISVGAFTVTGIRYTSAFGGVIDTRGSGINYFPGTIAGTGTNAGVAPYGFYG